MPTYEYHCTKCDIDFDVVQTMREKHEAACPECGCERTRRIFSMPAAKFITDAELSQRLMGVPRKRIERTKDFIYDKAVRQNNANTEREAISNEYHIPKRTRRK